MMRLYDVIVLVILLLIYLKVSKMSNPNYTEGMTSNVGHDCNNCVNILPHTRESLLCPTMCCPDKTDVELRQSISGVQLNPNTMCESMMYQSLPPIDAVLYKGLIPPS